MNKSIFDIEKKKERSSATKLTEESFYKKISVKKLLNKRADLMMQHNANFSITHPGDIEHFENAQKDSVRSRL